MKDGFEYDLTKLSKIQKEVDAYMLIHNKSFASEKHEGDNMVLYNEKTKITHLLGSVEKEVYIACDNAEEEDALIVFAKFFDIDTLDESNLEHQEIKEDFFRIVKMMIEEGLLQKH